MPADDKPARRSVWRTIADALVWAWALFSGVRYLLRPSPKQPNAAPPTPPHARSNESEVDAPVSPERRRFLMLITGAVGAGMTTLIGAPIVAFVLGPILKHEPNVWRDVGAVSDYKVGDTVLTKLEDPSPLPWAGVAGQQAVWLRHVDASTFIAFGINCTHLGCPVRWIDSARLFMCPCHGGVFYDDGTVATGPPKQPLSRHDVQVQDGRVQVRTRGVEITGSAPQVQG